MKMRKLAFALAGAAAIALLPSAAAMASTTPSPVSTHKLQPGVTFNPKTARCETVRTATGPTTRCVQVTRLPLKDLTTAQRAERKSMMTGLAKRQQQQQQQRESAAVVSPAVIPAAPAACNFSGIEFGLTVTAHPNRFLSCADTLLNVTVLQIEPTPLLLGSFSWEDQQWATLAQKSLTWTHGLQVLGYTELAFGDLADGVSGTMFSNCLPVTSGCTETSLGLPDPQQVAVVPGLTYNFGWTETDAGAASLGVAGQQDILNATLGVVWLIVADEQSTELDDIGALAVRCDTIAIPTTPGCVDQAFTPTLTYNSLTNPLVGPVAQHIYDAQRTLVTAWGVPSSVFPNGAPLTRDMNPADITANRTAACSGVAPSCDEYPMASTHQGAAFNIDFSTATVPPAANNSQGGLTRAFYRANRVIDPDPFYVDVILPNGTASW